MLERVILIVDDNNNVSNVHIPAYSLKINELKQMYPKWREYDFKLVHLSSMKDAVKYLEDKSNYVDVLVVDYDFGGEQTFTSGTDFVKYVRQKINRYCQIVFYTMQGLNGIDKEELIDLINSDVYQMFDKSGQLDELAEILFRAATQRNPIVESLERFWRKYHTLLETYNYKISGESSSFENMINHIRMDDEKGRIFIDKLLQKAILMDTDIEE